VTLERDEWSVAQYSHTLAPWKRPQVPIVLEAGWVPELVCSQRVEEESSASVGDWTSVVQSVVKHYTD
jgi:hypothetical protein